MKIRLRRLGKAILLSLAILLPGYIGSYVTISIHGRYEPCAIGLNGVKSYSWAPRGFVTDYKLHNRLWFFYCPLYGLDKHFWHTDQDAFSGKYPINRVDQKDIWKVYEANGF